MEKLIEIDNRLKNIESLLSGQKNVLNLDEVVGLTGLSKSHLYKLTCSNRIPFYKQAKHLFFDRAEIEKWLKENRSKTTAEIEEEAANRGLNKGGVK